MSYVPIVLRPHLHPQALMRKFCTMMLSSAFITVIYFPEKSLAVSAFVRYFIFQRVLVVILIDIEVVSIAHPFECIVKGRSRLIDKREVLVIV